MIDKEKRILITWATWFIWSNIVRKLVVEWFTHVHIFSREESNYFRINDILDKVTIHTVDLLDETKLNNIIDQIQPEVIFHLATAWAAVGKDPITITELYKFNVLWVINLINACKKNGFEYFINTGSSSEYGQKDAPMNEIDILEPNNDYGITKASATMYCTYIGKKEQLPIYTFRLFSVYWYYEEKRRLIPTLLLNYINNQMPNLSSPDSVRDYIFVEDVVNCYLNVDALNWYFWWIINIGYWEQYKIAEVVETIKKILNSDIQPNYWSEKKKQIEPSNWVSDNKKMLATFWLKPTPIVEWLQKTIERIKKNYILYT